MHPGASGQDSPDVLGEFCSKVNGLHGLKVAHRLAVVQLSEIVWAYLNVRIADDLRGSKFGDTDYKYATHHELLGVLFFQLVIRTDDDSQLPSDFSGRGGSNTCLTNTHTHVYIYMHIRCACVRTHNTRISAHGYRHNIRVLTLFFTTNELRGPRVYSHPLRRNAWSGLRNHGPLRRGGQLVSAWRIHPT